MGTIFEPVDAKVRFPRLEEEILRFWREHDIFRKSVEQRPADRQFTFYEGPPYANASPGIHHVLARVFKDVIVRFRTMQGYRVPRRAGWDTHGLPAELEVEKQLGITTKTDIEEKVGIAEFNRLCRENVMRYLQEWEALTERIAFWLDMEKAYVTYRNEYIESCWWVLKQLWDRGLIYRDYRTTPHCPRCDTTLSDHEVAQGYREDTPDPSIWVKFPLREEGRRRLAHLIGEGKAIYLVAWTTTPWTLPGNTALAVHPDAQYALAQVGEDVLVMASSLLPLTVEEFQILATVSGQELVGLRYEPLFDAVAWGTTPMWFDPAQGGKLVPAPPTGVEKAYTVVAADFVSLEEGTGIVHIAPAFGGEDFQLGRQEGLLYLQPVNTRGQFVGGPYGGKFVKDADEAIMEELQRRGLLLRRDVVLHTYPFCWRCGTPLIYYAKPSWYIRTTAKKERLVELNRQINWYPSHIREGRFGRWLENNVDWAISRERFWGIPLPFWECGACGQQVCIGSVEELRQRAVDQEAAKALPELHRPYVDAIRLRCPSCGGAMSRVPEVADVWFDSGSMPYAQWHYPFENREEFQRSFPADFICEGIDQTRGWFYTLHALSTLLFDSVCFRNCLCLELILDEKGEKMSKSRGNVVEPWPVIEAHGADAMRWYMFTSSPPWVPRRFSPALVAESLRRFLLTLWNTYVFFVTYANLDGFHPKRSPSGRPSVLDRWIISELHQLVAQVTRELESYNPTDAGRAIQEFVDDLSNWYVRRSRRRFWKSENDEDKLVAYHTLYTCLVTLCKLLAPFTPFVAEAMYQNLVRRVDPEAPESVHLCDWPQADPAQVDEGLMADMRLAMRITSLGRAARSKAGIKVRQPLSRLVVRTRHAVEREALQTLASLILEELNVKELRLAEGEEDLQGLTVASDDAGYAVGVDTVITPELAQEGLARELVHRIQNMRKAAGLEIADRIIVYYQGWEGLREVLARHGDYVRQETLSVEVVEGPPPAGAYQEEQKLDGHQVVLAVRRVR